MWQPNIVRQARVTRVAHSAQQERTYSTPPSRALTPRRGFYGTATFPPRTPWGVSGTPSGTGYAASHSPSSPPTERVRIFREIGSALRDTAIVLAGAGGVAFMIALIEGVRVLVSAS